MSNLKWLGANIRSLRKAYGETQEQLGEVIHVEKNTISYYETGKREPDKKILAAIAKHYTVSIEELLFSDLTSIGKIVVDKNAFWKNIDIILPMVSSDRAMKNDAFKEMFELHKIFYNQLHQICLYRIDVDMSFDCYVTALFGYKTVFDDSVENDDISAEAAANFIALWYLLLMMLKMCPEVIKDQPAALKQVVAKDEKIRKAIGNTDPSFEEGAQTILSDINDDEMKETVSKMLNTIKRSDNWSDLADYYLALQYIWNLVDNDLDWGFNQRIGVEMMNAFVSVKNIYAARFLKYSIDSCSHRGESSQFANDI